MTPIVDGQTYRFGTKGVYDGLSILFDEQTGSLWNHLTGESVHGPLQGQQLPVSSLLHMQAAQAALAYPDLPVSISERPIGVRDPGVAGYSRAALPDGFEDTIAAEDTRRPMMDVGLGIWTDATHRYYPMERVRAQGDALIDAFEDRRVLVYLDPRSHVLVGLYVDATEVRWAGEELHLDTGHVVREGILFDANGERHTMEYPLQQFTRWYGFALTFPRCEIFGDTD